VSSPRGSTLDDHYNYFYVDRVNSGDDQPTNDAGSGDQAARPRGYEGLDPSVVAALRQQQRPHEYVGLAAGVAAASTQQTTEVEIEMTELESVSNYQRAVSRLL